MLNIIIYFIKYKSIMLNIIYILYKENIEMIIYICIL